MRVVLLALLAAALLLAVYETDHFVVHSDDRQLGQFLEEAYQYYRDRGLTPQPPCGGQKYPVYLDPAVEGGLTSFGTSGCIYDIKFNPSYTKRLVAHEVAHIFIPITDYPDNYFWASEALPEAMAAVFSKNYYFPRLYFKKGLYGENPFSYGELQEEWYYYSAAFVWHIQNASDWRFVLQAVDKRGAARLYVQFLLGLARGVWMGGSYFEPQRDTLQVNTEVSKEVGGYSAAYFKVELPGPGLVEVEAKGVVSNLLLNREFFVDNGTLYLAIVNNGTSPTTAVFKIRFKTLKIQLLDGVYYGGFFSLRLYIEEGGRPASGVVEINGTKIPLSEGVGVYNFSGSLRPYVLNYKGRYLPLNFSEIEVEISPDVLYLGPGGRGVLNLTINNPNPLSIRCTAKGLKFSQSEFYVKNAYRLPFEAEEGSEGAVVRCGDVERRVAIYKPRYRLDYNLDKNAGVLTVWFGDNTGRYGVGPLPHVVTVNYSGYVAAVVSLPAPTPELRLSLINTRPLTYQGELFLKGDVEANYNGTIYINGSRWGYYSGGGHSLTLQFEPGWRYRMSIGRLAFEVIANATPIYAVVNKSRITLFIKVTLVGSGVALAAEDAVADVELKHFNELVPSPGVNITAVKVVVSPERIDAVLQVKLNACRPAVNVKYVVEVEGREITLEVPKGGCESSRLEVPKAAGYSHQRAAFAISTSLGVYSYNISVPPPRVAVELRRWSIRNGSEAVEVKVLIETPGNYTYIVMGQRVSGVAVINRTLTPTGGVAVLDYGFGKEVIERPQLYIVAPPAFAEIGNAAELAVTIRSPPELYIESELRSSHGGVLPLNITGGVANVTLRVPSPKGAGDYNVSLSLGPYSNWTYVTWYQVRLAVDTPRLVPIGREVAIRVSGWVYPPRRVSAVVEVTGCTNLATKTSINSTISLKAERPCVANISVYTNSSRRVATVEWASLAISFSYQKLGELKGLPIFAVGSLTASARLKDVALNVKLVGSFDKLGLVNYTAETGHMGITNATTFLGYAVPADRYLAAVEVNKSLSPAARPYFTYLLEKAVATGRWDLVSQVVEVYNAKTPLSVASRWLVDRQLAAGDSSGVTLARTLLQVEPFLYLALALLLVVAKLRGF